MVAAIFVLGLFLITLGGTGMFLAATLLPTDLGFAYFQAGTVGTSTGFIVLAIGLAARALAKAAERIAVPAPQRAPVGAISVSAHPASRDADEKNELVWPAAVARGQGYPSSPPAGVSSTAGAMIGGGALLAGAAAVTSAVAHGAVPAGGHADDLPPAASPPEQGSSSEQADLFAEAAIDHAPDPEMDSMLVDLLQHPAPVTEENAAALELVESADETVAPEQQPEAEVTTPDTAAENSMPAEAETPVLSLPQSTPGLIGDDDLVALEEAGPPLAPLDSLDVVGSYDSGGTRFTMYSDGSVTAAGPEGERRFASLDALRRSLDAQP